MKKILVTGGSGFIASHFIKRMEELEHEVLSYDIVDGNDILDISKFRAFVKQNKKSQVIEVWHFAAAADLNWARENPLQAMNINVQGTINVAQVCHEENLALNYVSTCCVYGNQKEHPEHEEMLPNPSELYACSKLAGENVVLAYNKMYGIRYNILRFPTTYGVGMRSALGVHIFFEQAMSGNPITLHGDGNQTRTLTYIDDLVDACILLHISGVWNQTLNLSAKESVSARQMAHTIRNITNSKSQITEIDQRPGQTFEEQIDSSKAEKLLGWTAKTSFKNGLLKTYEWLNKKKKGVKKSG